MRIFLAATTSGMNKVDKKEAFEIGKPLYCLETFFNGEKTCKKVLESVGKNNFLLDSGAFSFMSGAKCTKNTLRNYQKKYIEFINKYDVKYFFELDVDTIFGIEFVEQLRAELESKTHKKCIPVWHKRKRY